MRGTFREDAEFFLRAVERIPSDTWESPGLGVWTVRDLVGHTARALFTVETYLDTPADNVEIARPVDYFARAMESLAEPEEVAEPGHLAGQSLGPNPVSTVRQTVTRVLERLEPSPDNAVLGLPVGN